jgi:DNA-binding PadR family transcriptional regulator
MASMPQALTPTSYAILGLLAVKPWTTYELAQQMDRALGRFWPRAESRLYEEPKKLVAHGLARASSEMTGKRPRTVYAITAKGRRALAEWVPEPGEGPVVEFEQLIKVFFAEHGTKQDLLATLASVRESSIERLGGNVRVPEAYVNGDGPFPERLPWLLLVGEFLVDFYLMVEHWADWASEIVAAWPDDITDAQPDRKTLERHLAITTSHARKASRSGSAS